MQVAINPKYAISAILREPNLHTPIFQRPFEAFLSPYHCLKHSLQHVLVT
jgi:hypothetical protein